MRLNQILQFFQNFIIALFMLSAIFYGSKFFTIINFIKPTCFSLENRDKEKSVVFFDNSTLYFIIKIDRDITKPQYDYLYFFFGNYLNIIIKEFPYIKVKIIFTLSDYKATDTLHEVSTFFREACNSPNFFIDYNGSISSSYKLQKRPGKVFIMNLDRKNNQIKIAPIHLSNCISLTLAVLNHVYEGKIIQDMLSPCANIDEKFIINPEPNNLDLDYYKPQEPQELCEPYEWFERSNALNLCTKSDQKFVINAESSDLALDYYKPQEPQELCEPYEWFER